MIGRQEFTDLRALLVKHIDFAALPALVDPESPTLLLGAGDILEGSFKIFSSALGEISIDAVLASAAIPNLFPAVQIGGHAYWDGIFASNPPVFSFLRGPLMGKGKVPDEIWIIQVNRTKRQGVPEAPSEISDRRNDLAGNLSLQHELEVIDMVNMLLQEGALTPEFRARFGLEATERITVRFIRMSQELQETLDYPSKMSRLPAHIDRLIADGETPGDGVPLADGRRRAPARSPVRRRCGRRRPRGWDRDGRRDGGAGGRAAALGSGRASERARRPRCRSARAEPAGRDAGRRRAPSGGIVGTGRAGAGRVARGARLAGDVGHLHAGSPCRAGACAAGAEACRRQQAGRDLAAAALRRGIRPGLHAGLGSPAVSAEAQSRLAVQVHQLAGGAPDLLHPPRRGEGRQQAQRLPAHPRRLLFLGLRLRQTARLQHHPLHLVGRL